ncbi:hypothetical protein D9615_000858 [Tricholomella constricta]|uniref:Uncharacterized protein n=1 Tax=Tricholomella constricta TaxID=117010 RepID=A0A8H5MB40_9AGAR|nr:hypothetical protein D9615_000858 [Tricholomella constricta]
MAYHESTAREFLNLFYWGRRWSKISRLNTELMKLRITLVTTSQEERARRGEQFLGPNVHVSQSAEEGTRSLGPSGVAAERVPEHPSPSLNSASNASSTPMRRSSFCICSLLQWLSTRCGRSSKPSSSDGSAQGEADSSVPDSLSRSSTLVEDPPPKAPCWRQVILGKWAHDTNGPVLEDLEAGSGPRTSFFFETPGACDEPTEMDISAFPLQ